MNRRDFLKTMGIGAAAVSAASLTSCAGNKAGNAAQSAENSAETSAENMTYRTNPTTGDKVSLLGYGCMRWPMKSVGGRQEFDQETINDLVDYAIAHGVNYFDTAPVYGRGQSETVTGIALQNHPRNSYYIATKLSNHDSSLWSREASMNMYRNSFKALQTDYIDYYLLHSVGGGGIPTLEGRYLDNGMLEFLLKEREAGRIRNLGFSFHGDVEVFDWMLEHHDHYHWDFVQIQMNYVDWRHAQEVNPRNVDAEYLYGELDKRGIPAVIMEPLLGGRLSKVHDHIAAKLQQREPESSVASWAFRFCGSYPGVLTVLSGMTYMEHLLDNLKTYSPLKPLTDDEFAFLEETARLLLRYPTIPCNNCDYCMPCPYGIDIPGIFTHFNKCINEGYMPSSSQDPFYRKERRAFLVGYDRSVPKLRQADHCIGCRQCNPKCPQNINIPQQMQRVNDFVEDLKQGKEF
ncbi:MAG: aldo/keto reductase [Bacteroidales bacterium]|nr:aldo/keto reductase [Bacteroidales bacterium]